MKGNPLAYKPPSRASNSMGPEPGQDDGVDVGEEVGVLDGVRELDGVLVAVSV